MEIPNAEEQVGVDDFVLLKDHESIDAFVDNLKIRFEKGIIYTNIQNILISVNPYKELPIYGEDVMLRYSEKHLRLRPHIYDVINQAFERLVANKRSQCVLISGESGAGKTKASEIVLNLIVHKLERRGSFADFDDKLLRVHCILDAFGNAQTEKSDNSSRFDSYMEIEFDHNAQPLGQKLCNYLLEKSRVIEQIPGQKNFHIFHYLLGSSPEVLSSLKLKGDEHLYRFISNPVSYDPRELKKHEKSMNSIKSTLTLFGILDNEQNEVFKILASILHLGNVTFKESESASAFIECKDPIKAVCELLGCAQESLEYVLTKRTVETMVDIVISPLNKEIATWARNALVKAVYHKLFLWLIRRINESLESPTHTNYLVFGILDIFGFEVTRDTGYEQFCINYCNEKLHQLFVELTFKKEQEEYEEEGISWVPIDYFNNRIICELIEERHKGIIDMLNEECALPIVASDAGFLERMNQNLITHRYYESHSKGDIQSPKAMERNEFQLTHYAGNVKYKVDGFVDKNNDLLFRDMMEFMVNTTNSIAKSFFTAEEIASKKLPASSMSQYRKGLNQLMENLLDKEPSYIRCIKSNNFQAPNNFDVELVKEQVKYLGLLKCLAIKRAGFAYRSLMEPFFRRYKVLNRKTWLNYTGTLREGIRIILRESGINFKDFELGRTKVFLRSITLYEHLEKLLEEKKEEIATIIQKRSRGFRERRNYQTTRRHIITIQALGRRLIAKRCAERRRNAVRVIRRFIEGFIEYRRVEEETDLTKNFVQLARARWLRMLAENLPRSVLDKSWPSCPPVCKKASEILRELYMKKLAAMYISSITPELKRKFQEKVLAESLFKGRKRLYESSVPNWFERDRLEPQQRQKLGDFVGKNRLIDDDLVYKTVATKYDRHGYKIRDRVMLFGKKFFYFLDGKTFKLKHKLSYENITELTVTTEGDSFLLIRISLELKKDKGDLIVEVPNLIEAVTMFIDNTQYSKVLKVTNESKILHHLIGEKSRTIKVVAGSTGSIPEICKRSGELVIMG